MPSHEQPELKRDRDIPRTLSAHSRRCLGVYGTVARAGRIAVGDPLDLEPARRSALAAAAGAAGARVKRVLMRAGNAAMPKG
jgi:hypothetical protein